jgi:DNA polymerase III delta subunit
MEAYVVFLGDKLPYRTNAKDAGKILEHTYSFEVSKREYRTFLTAFLKRFQKRMTPQAQSVVLEMYTNLYDLYNNIEKLSLSSEDKDVIDESDLDIVTTCSHNISSFNFIDELGNRNITGAMKILDELLSRGETFYSLIGLLRIQFLNLLKASQMLKKGESSSTVCQKLGIFPFKRGLFMQQIKNFSSRKLFQNIKILSHYDFISKSTSLSSDHLMQMLVIELCTDEQTQ